MGRRSSLCGFVTFLLPLLLPPPVFAAESADEAAIRKLVETEMAGGTEHPADPARKHQVGNKGEHAGHCGCRTGPQIERR